MNLQRVIRTFAAAAIASMAAVDPAFAEQRSFLMGTTMIAELSEPRFENLDDKDLLSLHLDDFLGVPWIQFRDGTTLPSAWVNQWESIRSQAAASGKVLYLATSPLASRKTLTSRVNDDGTKTFDWAPVDGSGCYTFATDAQAEGYKRAYINYMNYLINLIRPTYVSPAIEINSQWRMCSGQKAAFKAWYADVHAALKEANPTVVIFPTFQLDDMYGISEASAWCGGIKTDVSLAACFQQRLDEALQIPGDRMALSSYPLAWSYRDPPDTYTQAVPWNQTFTMIKQATRKKMWIAETGFQGAQIYQSYFHASPASACGVLYIPAPAVVGDAKMTSYLTDLLGQAQTHGLEAVIWWENRDLLDATIASQCPCPGANTTCTNTELYYQIGGTSAEILLRFFGNMGLRYYDGTPRAGVHDAWMSYLSRTHTPVPGADPNSLDHVQIYPNPLRPSQGHTGISFVQLPPGAGITIHALAGEKLKDLAVEPGGHAIWDGTNRSGRRVASGVYMALIRSDGASKTVKVAVQR